MQPFVAGMRTGRGLFVLTLKRLASRPGLTILALIGIVLAVGLLSSAAFFAQAVDRVILNQELAELSAATNRPAFSTRIYFFPSSRKRMGIEAAERAGSSISGTLAAEIGLGVDRKDLQMESGSMVLLPAQGDTAYTDIREYLTSVNIVYIEGVATHLNIVQGDAFTDVMGAPDVLNAWMHLSLAK